MSSICIRLWRVFVFGHERVKLLTCGYISVSDVIPRPRATDQSSRADSSPAGAGLIKEIQDLWLKHTSLQSKANLPNQGCVFVEKRKGEKKTPSYESLSPGWQTVHLKHFRDAQEKQSHLKSSFFNFNRISPLRSPTFIRPQVSFIFLLCACVTVFTAMAPRGIWSQAEFKWHQGALPASAFQWEGF